MDTVWTVNNEHDYINKMQVTDCSDFFPRYVDLKFVGYVHGF